MDTKDYRRSHDSPAGTPTSAATPTASFRRVGEESIDGLEELTSPDAAKAREAEKHRTLRRLQDGVPLRAAVAPEVAQALADAVHDDEAEALPRALPVSDLPFDVEPPERDRSTETQLARALGQAAAIVQWSDAKARYLRRQRKSLEKENTGLREDLAALEAEQSGEKEVRGRAELKGACSGEPRRRFDSRPRDGRGDAATRIVRGDASRRRRGRDADIRRRVAAMPRLRRG